MDDGCEIVTWISFNTLVPASHGTVFNWKITHTPLQSKCLGFTEGFTFPHFISMALFSFYLCDYSSLERRKLNLHPNAL